jgi:hypothetical protein
MDAVNQDQHTFHKTVVAVNQVQHLPPLSRQRPCMLLTKTNTQSAQDGGCCQPSPTPTTSFSTKTDVNLQTFSTKKTICRSRSELASKLHREHKTWLYADNQVQHLPPLCTS